MTPKEAKKVLQEMKAEGCPCKDLELTEDHIYSDYKYMGVDFRSIVLDGTFTIEELEAIVVWYKDPKGVVNA